MLITNFRKHINTTVTRFKRFEVRVSKQEKSTVLWLNIKADNITPPPIRKNMIEAGISLSVGTRLNPHQHPCNAESP